jgi:hypothetical protein
LPPPVANKTVNAGPAKGRIRYQRPRTKKSKGEGFQPLKKPRVFPVGTLFDTRKGRVKLATAGPGGQRQVAEFGAGLFQALQNRGTRGLTEARLKGASFSRKRCTVRRKRRRSHRSSNGAPTADASRRRRRLRRKTVRKLRFSGRGSYRATARGRNSGTVRGTVFSVSDRCDGVLWKVKRGKVLVRHGRKKVLVKAGRSYLAKRRG